MTDRNHPFYVRYIPSVRPARYTWEVFGRDGRLEGRVRFPSRFQPMAFVAGVVFGFVEAEDGTRSLARAALPAFAG